VETVKARADNFYSTFHSGPRYQIRFDLSLQWLQATPNIDLRSRIKILDAP